MTRKDDGCALQIVRTTESNSFEFVEENLAQILDQISEDMTVSVVSVVGSFRTGKSFLLSFFLRYLEYSKDFPGEKSMAWMHSRGDRLQEGNSNSGVDSPDVDFGFKWRGGTERQTTGIWMWSKPFFRKSAIEGGAEIAVLLVDTQGMFDNETTMALTSCIFGISTLISSHQIYNVEKRISEDNLQHLAMFAEYGRAGVSMDGAEDDEDGQEETKLPRRRSMEEQVPFQHLEFLIRDWQDFEDEDDVERCEREIDEYWASVKAVETREAEDLRSTREQITSCFRSTTAFALTHPGSKVTKKTYDGRIEDMDPSFRRLLDHYVRRVFSSENLDPKSIFGHNISILELKNYVKTYTKLFEAGVFPEATTMLAATVRATTENARQSALNKYQHGMDRECGPEIKTYVNTKKLELAHNYHMKSALTVFDKIATIGSRRTVAKTRSDTEETIEKEWKRYKALNSARNPLRNMEAYIIPAAIAFIAMVLRFFSGTCSSFSDTCRDVSDTLSFITTAIFLFLIISNIVMFKALYEYAGTVLKRVGAGENFMVVMASVAMDKKDT